MRTPPITALRLYRGLPTLPSSKRRWRGGEELGIPGAGGIETISDVGERRGRGKSSTRGEQPTVVPGGGVPSRINTWERLNAGGEGGGISLVPEKDGRGGRRKSQNFTDLCRKFEERENVLEQESKFEETILRSKDTHHNSDFRNTFTSLRDNWDNSKCGKTVSVRQSQLRFVNGQLSLARVSTNNKRALVEGEGDKGSAAKRKKKSMDYGF